MAKRFTDTGKWGKEWFRLLSPKMKCAWIFLCDNCDHAGIWDISLPTLRHFVGEEITIEEISSEFEVEIIDNKILVLDFVKFQYGDLNPTNRVHQSVILKLDELRKNKGLTSPMQGAKDKDKEKDKDKDKEKGECEGISKVSSFENRFKFDFNALIAAYPNHQRKNKAMALMASKISTQAEYERLRAAITNYSKFCQDRKLKFQFIKQFVNWFEDWEFWEYPENFADKFADAGGSIDWEFVFGRKGKGA